MLQTMIIKEVQENLDPVVVEVVKVTEQGKNTDK